MKDYKEHMNLLNKKLVSEEFKTFVISFLIIAMVQKYYLRVIIIMSKKQ